MTDIEKAINLLTEVSTDLYNLELSRTYELGSFAKEYVNQIRKSIDEVLPTLDY
tara:strand:+ start:320 stop:481 length:162 start_codon:yes stop_codon:yes gene_type:complete